MSIAACSTLLSVNSGRHTHLDIPATRLAGQEPAEPFWDQINRLRPEYEQRIPG